MKKSIIIVYLLLSMVVVLIGYLSYSKTEKLMLTEVESNLKNVASLIVSEIENDDLDKLKSSISSSDSQANKDYQFVLNHLRTLHKSIKKDYLYVYTIHPGPNDTYLFGVDTAEPIDKDGDGKIDQAQLNEKYETPPEELILAMQTKTHHITKTPYTDAWGTFYSIFYPIKDKEGNLVSVLGIDLTVVDFLKNLENLKQTTIIFVSLIELFLLFSFITIYKLFEIFEKSELQKQEMIQSQKLIEVGVMASSITHEINNPLSVIRMNAEIILSKKEAQEKGIERIHKIIKAIDRIQSTISQMKRFVKKDDSGMEIKDINSIISSTLEFLDHKIKGVDVSLLLTQDDVSSYCFENQISQVLINLIVNATEVMSKESKPLLSITSFKDANDIVIKVKNSGPTIPMDLWQKIEKGFVTTKENGSGMGLMISKQILSEHDGSISYGVEDGMSAFTIRILQKNNFKQKEAS